VLIEPGTTRFLFVMRLAEASHHRQHHVVSELLSDLPAGLIAVQSRHRDVKQHDIGSVLIGKGGFRTVVPERDGHGMRAAVTGDEQER
jgi:hypothetical protein